MSSTSHALGPKEPAEGSAGSVTRWFVLASVTVPPYRP